ncbi:MAG: zinc-ribbon domain-containing protein [Pyrinomonadaceae bacterium]
MIVLCPSCETHLQFDDKKFSSGPFTIRCPKCRTVVRGKSDPNGEIKEDAPGPGIMTPRTSPGTNLPGAVGDDLLRMLSALLSKGSGVAPSGYGWDGKQALICVGSDRRELAADVLKEAKYHIETPVEKSLAIDILRDRHIDLVLLDDNFDAANHGSENVRQEIARLRSVDRRRVYLVYLDEDGRTMDQLSAFLENYNLIVNPKDLPHLPQALERSLRDYNELYRHFNAAIGSNPM